MSDEVREFEVRDGSVVLINCGGKDSVITVRFYRRPKGQGRRTWLQISTPCEVTHMTSLDRSNDDMDN